MGQAWDLVTRLLAVLVDIDDECQATSKTELLGRRSIKQALPGVNYVGAPAYLIVAVRLSSLVSCPLSGGPKSPRSMRAWPTHLARLLTGMPSRWAVSRHLVLVGLVINGQSEGHGMTPIDLFTKTGQTKTARF